mgnify:CR=1 FL=1
MAALDALKPLSDGPPPSWRDRLASRIDQWMTSPALNRWASSSLFTRWLVRRRSVQLFDLMAGFVHSQVLLACVRLKLFDLVLEEPRTAAELATLCRVPLAHLPRLLDSAVALGRLEPRGTDRYGLGPLGAPVASHAGIRDMIEHNAVLYEDMRDPLALLRDPNAARMHAYWPYTEDPAGKPQAPAPVDQFARYSSLMSTSQRFVIEELLAAYPFADHRRVLDVGGGMGGWVSALANRHSHQGADDDHQYGHQRYETAASFIVGLMLLAVGVGMLWQAVIKLSGSPEDLPKLLRDQRRRVLDKAQAKEQRRLRLISRISSINIIDKR